MIPDVAGEDSSPYRMDLHAAGNPKAHVFCVNGSSEFLEMVTSLLTEEGYAVTTTFFLETTFDQLLAACPDVIIVDIIPGRDVCFAFLKQLHEDPRTTKLPTLVLSTSAVLLETARNQPDIEADRYFLEKPFNIDDLLGAVRQAASEGGIESN